MMTVFWGSTDTCGVVRKPIGTTKTSGGTANARIRRSTAFARPSVQRASAMDPVSLTTCLGHLLEAEKLLDAAGDLASLARLAFVIDMLRRSHGLPDRDFLEVDILGGPAPM